MPSKLFPAFAVLGGFSAGITVGAFVGHFALGAFIGLGAGFAAGLFLLGKIGMRR